MNTLQMDLETKEPLEMSISSPQQTFGMGVFSGPIPGPQGQPGAGVAEGGKAGQVLAKRTDSDYDTEWVDFIGQDILSLKRLGAYLYEVTFDTIPERTEQESNNIASCTSFVRDGKLYRNLDWNYDNTAEFKVIAKDFTGMSFVNGLNDGALDKDLISQLPYFINDGVNKDGIMVSSHVLYNDWRYAGAGRKDKKLTELPYFILTNVHSMEDLSVLNDYLSNIKVNDYLVNADYLMQFLVTDGTTTYAILPPTSETGSYVLQDITSLPKLTNFSLVNKATLQRNDSDLQNRPTGVERWNLIGSSSLEDLRFTVAYESPVRLSEFIGIRETTKDSTDAELEAIYDIAHQKYLTRTRNGELWQTVHSVVYIPTGFESLYVQEDFNKNYIAYSKTAEGISEQDLSEEVREKLNRESITTWGALQDKPFSTLGSTLKSENGVLNVKTVDVVQEDNTLPITSNGVAITVGNINALLQLI